MSETTTSPEPTPRALDGLLERFVDRCNPILVKEVRQALRGRNFRIAFLCVLAAATFVATAAMINMRAEVSSMEGRRYVSFVYFCLSVAVNGLVPFAAFNAMGAEWEENTYDLLVLSRLRPRHIVLGKLLGAQAQAGLYLATFAPFLVLGTLMKGVDPRALLVLLGFTMVYGAAATCMSLMLSSLTKVRFARVVLMALLAFLLFLGIVFSVNAAESVLRSPGDLFSGEGPLAMAGTAGAIVLPGLLFACMASNLLSHPEENRSTNLRLLGTSILLLTLGYFVVISLVWGIGGDMPEASVGTGFAFVFFLSLFFTTERDRLGVRVRNQVPRGFSTALLATPWLPGGGRGGLWYALHVLLLFVYLVVLKVIDHGGPAFGHTHLMLAALALYGWVYLMLPSRLMASGADEARVRVLTRFVIPVAFLLLLFLPALLGYFVGSERMMELRHPGNPFWLMIESWEGNADRMIGTWVLVALVAVLTLVINVNRIERSVREVLAARAERVQRETTHGGGGAPTP